MADFRKWILALAVAALFLSAVPASAQVTPSAQQMVCTTFAQPAPNRSEGIAELQGDIVLNCTGGTNTANTTPATAVPTYNIQVTLNTNVTSNVVATTGTVLEAALIIDNATVLNNAGNLATSATPAISASAGGGCGDGNGCDYQAGLVNNIFLGRRTANGTILFSGIPIDPPGTTSSRILRITNVRANASATNGQPITAFITTQPAGASPASAAIPLTNPLVTVGVPSSTLSFAVRNATGGTGSLPAALPICANNQTGFRDDPVANPAPAITHTLRWVENQIAGFKSLPGNALAGTAANTLAALETGTLIPGGTFTLSGGSTALPTGIGSANSGTRLRAALTNVPANVRVFVSVNNTGAGTQVGIAQLRLASTDANGASFAVGGGFVPPINGVTTLGAAPPAPVGYAEVPVNNGTAVAVWEVVDNNSTITETLFTNVVLAFSANRPTAGTVSAAGSLAPVSSNTTGSTNAGDLNFPVPRFVDTSSASAAVNLNPCVTNMLFPFVTNTAGFDTGIAISNTTSDPFGTTGQSGTCTLNYYGTNAAGVTPPANTSQAVAAGAQLVGTLSGGGNLGFAQAAGFQGYMIAQCNFRYGHGFAFVSDVGARNLAMGYLALIITPDRGAGSTVESLGN